MMNASHSMALPATPQTTRLLATGAGNGTPACPFATNAMNVGSYRNQSVPLFKSTLPIRILNSTMGDRAHGAPIKMFAQTTHSRKTGSFVHANDSTLKLATQLLAANSARVGGIASRIILTRLSASAGI